MNSRSEQIIDQAFAVAGYAIAALFALTVASGFYAMTNLPLADLIRSWWL